VREKFLLGCSNHLLARSIDALAQVLPLNTRFAPKATIPVRADILITAYPNEKHRKRALDNGAVGFLSEPFDDEALIECLTAAIRLRVPVSGVTPKADIARRDQDVR
jgi:CheY-like chemotaxis protein